MGTKFRIVLFTHNDSLARTAAREAFDKIEELNGVFSDYKFDSELNRLSRQSGNSKWIETSQPLFQVLKKAQQISHNTNGAFDITVGPYVDLWRSVRRSYKPSLPASDTVEKRSKTVGYKNLLLHKKDQKIQLLQPGMQLDAGGIAKGYAADKALEVLNSFGILSALIDAGGDITAGSAPPNKKGWKISIPSHKAGETLLIQLANKAVATSGDLFQYVEINGERYSHIIDPRSGMGLTHHTKVTVIARDGITADGYASAVSVLGAETGIKFLKAAPHLEGFIEVKHNNKIQQLETPGFQNLSRK